MGPGSALAAGDGVDAALAAGVSFGVGEGLPALVPHAERSSPAIAPAA
jgi:hypothetical protein